MHYADSQNRAWIQLHWQHSLILTRYRSIEKITNATRRDVGARAGQ